MCRFSTPSTFQATSRCYSEGKTEAQRDSTIPEISASTLRYHQSPAGRQDSTVLLALASSFPVPVLLSSFPCLFPLGPRREDIEGNTTCWGPSVTMESSLAQTGLGMRVRNSQPSPGVPR